MSDNDKPVIELRTDGNEEPQVQKKKVSPKKGKAGLTSEAKKFKIIEMAAKDFSQHDIAKAVGVPRTTVRDIIKKFGKVFKALDRVGDYRNSKADLLAAAQLTALESAMSDGKLKKAGFLGTLKGYEILNKAERLELGKSTENHQHIGVFTMNGMQEEA